jgi:hypothetical protein
MVVAEAVIICALWGGACLVAVDGAYLGSYIAANNDRPEGMPSYFADEREKQMYAMKLRGQGAEPPEYEEVERSSARYSEQYSVQHSFPSQHDARYRRRGGEESSTFV